MHAHERLADKVHLCSQSGHARYIIYVVDVVDCELKYITDCLTACGLFAHLPRR